MIGRIISLIVGIIFLIVATNISTTIDNIIPEINHGIAVCNSTLGRLGSLIFRDRAQQCEQVTQEAPTIIAYGSIAQVAFYTIGGFCTTYGVVMLVGMEIVRRRRTTLSQ
jgi:predicted PurR-regulated permease PerM